MRTRATAVFRRPRVDFDPADYETRQVFYASKDGTRVPMTIVHRNCLARAGTTRAERSSSTPTAPPASGRN